MVLALKQFLIGLISKLASLGVHHSITERVNQQAVNSIAHRVSGSTLYAVLVLILLLDHKQNAFLAALTVMQCLVLHCHQPAE